MKASDSRFFRLAMFAEGLQDEGDSFARKLKEGLEAQGHTVFWFDSASHPFVFSRKGVLRGYMVREFFRVQRLDGVLLVDGLAFDYPQTAQEAASAPIGAVFAEEGEVASFERELSYSGGWSPDFILFADEGCLRAIEGSSLSQVRRGAVRTDGGSGLLDADLGECLASEGSPYPRSIACVFGYLGVANYANERVLATIDARLRHRVEGSSVIAISLDPRHTLEHRGIYALSMDDKHSLDEALAHASVVLVVAGLLNDNSMRWSMGKAEMLCNADGCGLAAIAALATLCSLNDARFVLYGGGVGPLDLPDSRKMVRFLNTLGSVFVTRDEGCANLLLESGVSRDALVPGADPMLLGEFERTAFVDSWLAERDIDAERDQILAVTLRSGAGFPDDFSQRVAAVLASALAERPRLRVVLCALDASEGGLLEKVKQMTGLPDRVNIFFAGERPDAMSDMLSRAHAGFSMQYYGTLALMRAGVPCMGVACQQRESFLFEETGCESLSLCADASEDEMSAALANLLDRRGEWSEKVREGMRALSLRARDGENLVVRLMDNRSGDKAFDVALWRYPYERSASDRALARKVEGLEGKVRQAEEDRDDLYRIMGSREYRLGSALTSAARKLGFSGGRSSREEKVDE